MKRLLFIILFITASLSAEEKIRILRIGGSSSGNYALKQNAPDSISIAGRHLKLWYNGSAYYATRDTLSIGIGADTAAIVMPCWNTAYTDRMKWDGGASGLVAATGRTSLGLKSMSLVDSVVFKAILATIYQPLIPNISDTAYYGRTNAPNTWKGPQTFIDSLANNNQLSVVNNIAVGNASNAITAWAPNLAPGRNISFGFGKTFSSGNSAFFGWLNSAGTPFAFLETYGGSSPMRIRASNWNVDTLGAALFSSISVTGGGLAARASLGLGTMAMADSDYVKSLIGSGGSSSTDTNAVHYNASKKVGIGTDTAAYKLDVVGSTATDGIQSNIGFNITSVPTPAFSNSNASLVASAGNLGIGEYRYTLRFITPFGMTGTGNYGGGNCRITTVSGSQRVLITLPVSTDQRVTGRKLYRTKVGSTLPIYELATINNNTDTAYTDNIADASLTVQGNYYGMPNSTNNGLSFDGKRALWADAATQCALGGASVGNSGMIGGGNVLFGTNLGQSITTGNYNSCFGSAGGMTTGSGNTFMGYNAGYWGSNGSSNSNVGIGYYALYGASGQAATDHNTALGYNAGSGRGSYNLDLGAYAGTYDRASYRFYLNGVNVTDSTMAVAKAMMVGTFSSTTANQILTINGRLGINNLNPLSTFDVTGSGRFSDTVTVAGTGIISSAYRLSSLSTAPATSTSSGVAGEMRFAADAIYICTATNTWVKANLSTW